MPRIDGLFFGYTVFSVEEKDAPSLVNALLRLGINASVKRDFTCEVRVADGARLRSELRGKIDFTETEILGLPGFIYRNRHCYGTFLGLVLGVFIFVWCSGAVWDVRLSSDGADDGAALSSLEELGLYSGARWGEIDKNALEAKLRLSSDDISWVNVNRRGTVAYVTLGKKNGFEKEKNKTEYSNVVASEDAIIEEINVRRGFAVVKAGDAVKKGDVLISGIIPGELGGGFVRAEGSVVGRVYGKVSASVCASREEKVYVSCENVGISYKILGFSINILKNSRNFDGMCDIIEYKSQVTLFGRYRLPLERCVKARLEYKVERRSLGSDEIVKAAAQELGELFLTKTADAEVISIKTDGSFVDGGYTMYSEYTVLKNIGKEVPISVSEEKERFVPDG